MMGEQNAAQQELLGVVGWGWRGMGHRPLSSFPVRGRATLAGLDPGSLGAAPEGGRPGRRRPTHPPPQEAERCTWRPVLQLSPETGPAGRERRQRRRRGRAQDPSGRRSGQKVARRLRQATAVARPTRLASSRRARPPARPPLQPRDRSEPPDRHAELWPARRRRPGAPSRRPAPRGQGSPRPKQLSAAR